MRKKLGDEFSPEHHQESNRLSYAPSFVSALRLVAFPFLVFFLNVGQTFLGDCLFLFVLATDFADGRLAKRLGVPSEFGARFDATVDFLFILGMFLNFVGKGFYPFWVLLLMTFMYTQFIVTSFRWRVIYDPFGKYYGSLLYGAVGLTMLFPTRLAYDTIAVCTAIVTLVSLASRLLHFMGKRSTHDDGY
jgi:phosphatidylglycerophosphate synthase